MGECGLDGVSSVPWRQLKSRLGHELGASNTAVDPRPELAAVWIPDRGGDDRPAASRIPALRTAGRPHVRRIAAAADKCTGQPPRDWTIRRCG